MWLIVILPQERRSHWMRTGQEFLGGRVSGFRVHARISKCRYHLLISEYFDSQVAIQGKRGWISAGGR